FSATFPPPYRSEKGSGHLQIGVAKGVVPFRCSARLHGAAAQRVIADIGRGRVLAVFPHSFYVANEAGNLACVGALALGPGPLNLLCTTQPAREWPSLGLRPGTPVRRVGDTLRIGDACAIELGAATTWRPP